MEVYPDSKECIHLIDAKLRRDPVQSNIFGD